MGKGPKIGNRLAGFPPTPKWRKSDFLSEWFTIGLMDTRPEKNLKLRVLNNTYNPTYSSTEKNGKWRFIVPNKK